MATRRQIVTLVLAGDNSELFKSLSLAEKETVQRTRNIIGGVAAVGTAAVAIGAKFTSMATEINTGMAEVSTLIPGQTKRIEELRSAVQDLSVEYGTPTEGLVGGLYQGISAFGDTADTLDILAINTKAAKSGVASVAESIALTSAVTKGYNTVSAKGVQLAADLAFKTVELGQTTFPELAASIGNVTPLANELGVSQQELFGVMATATGVTGNAAVVSTQFRGVLAAMMKPTADLAKLYEELGVENAKQLIEQRGFQGALEAITGAAKDSGVPLTKYLGRVEATTLALALSGAQSENWTIKTAAMNDAAGGVDVAFENMTQGVNKSAFAVDQWKQMFAVGMQKAGQSIINFSGPLGSALLGVAQFGGSLSMMAPQISSVTLLLKGSRLATMAMNVQQKALNLAMRLNPIGLVVTAIALVALGIYKWRTEILDFLSGAWDKLKNAVFSAKSWLGPLGRMFGDTTDEVAHLTDELAGHSLTTALSEAAEESDTLRAELDRLLRIQKDSIPVTDELGSAIGELSIKVKEAEEKFALLRDEQARLMGVSEAALLVTDIQWASYQKLWDIGTPVTDVLVSHNRFSSEHLAGVVPTVTSSIDSLRDEEGKLILTGETYRG